MSEQISYGAKAYSGFQISKPQLASLGVGCGVWGVVNAHENGCMLQKLKHWAIAPRSESAQA
jgi:hypothetical protein